MRTYKELADLIFPDIKDTIEDLEKRYPERNLPEGAEVTRFAPSPTGFLHTGSLFTTLVGQKIAKQSNGVFYTRLEDTDTKREIAGSGQVLLDQLKVFGVFPNEGYLGDHSKGNYGPYIQSQREGIYKIVIKALLEQGKAYPCFCTREDLDILRKSQEEKKLIPGYYGEHAKCRFLTTDEQYDKIVAGVPFVIRFKSSGNHENKVSVHDLVRGDLELSQNDQDIVIYKSDGLPTYHFAHLVDDHFMRTTIVTRGEEWLPSLPIHIELFETMGWKAPKYAHLPVIMKTENGVKRKLSKRKDKEAATSFFLEEGYPAFALKQYLFTIANSNYEEWQIANPDLSFEDFTLSFDKMSLFGALFDNEKLKFFAREYFGKMRGNELKDFVKDWAKEYNEEVYNLIVRDEDFFARILDIEKDKPNPRKDYATCSEILPKISFMFDEYYEKIMKKELPWNPNMPKDVIVSVLQDFIDTLDFSKGEQEWFNGLKELGLRHKFAESGKIYKANKDAYIGQVGDVAEMVRISLSGSKQSPNIFYVLNILGTEKVKRRIELAISLLK